MNRRELLKSMLEPVTGGLAMPGSLHNYARPGDPACQAMTDFRNGPMITTPASTSIELALQQMKLSGARFAFVVGDKDTLVGSVTSYDIQGEKPIRYLQSLDHSLGTGAWRDVTVENIMEPLAEWQVIGYSAVERLTIGDVASLLSDTDRRYLVVAERMTTSGTQHVRGLFSAARIHMLLGTAAPGVTAAHTFAEIEREIVQP